MSLIMNKKVVILGNGFDLNLGLRTSYPDFLRSHEFQKLYSYHRNYIIDRLANNYNLINWIDIENELRQIALEYNNIDKSNLIEFKRCYQELNNALRIYLKRETLEKDLKPSINTPAAKLLKLICDNPDDYIVFSFNFTNLNKFAQSLGFSTQLQYTNVHGSLDEENIIIGFEDDVEKVENFSFMIKTFNPYYSSVHIRKVLDEAKEVIIFGHSLGKTDYHYFSKFFKKITQQEGADSIILSIITANDSSRLAILDNLRKMNENKTNILFDKNEIKMYSACVYATQFKLHQLFRRLEVESELMKGIKQLNNLTANRN